MNKITVDAKTENLDRVLDFVNLHLKKKNCPPKVQIQIGIAVEEIFVNIAHYAYGEKNGKAVISLNFSKSPLSVTITFIDKGIHYDPLSKADPDISLSAEERQIGGLGIYMVKKSMDDVKYEYKNGCNIL